MKFYSTLLTSACVILASIHGFSGIANSSGSVSDARINSPVASPAVTVTVTKETGGVEAGPLNSGQTVKAILGIKIQGDGAATLNSLIVQLSNDPAGKLSNIKLYSSADNTYDAGDTDTGVVPTVTTSHAQFSSLGAAVSTSAIYFFVVADISSSVNSSTAHVKPSLANADVTVAGATVNAFSFDGVDYGFLDIINPVASATPFSPADGSTNAPTNTSTIVINFAEPIQKVPGAATTNADRIIIKKFSDDTNALPPIDRDDAAINVSGSTVTITLSGALTSGTHYYVTIGGNVFEDAEGNNYAGTPTKGDWDFSINSGAVVTALTTEVCSSFSPLSQIKIEETAINNFNGVNGGSRVLKLVLDNPAFAFQIGAAAQAAIVASAGGDITGIVVNSLTFSSVTLTISFDASANDEMETITIDGLKIGSDGTSSPGHVRIDASSTFAAENVSNTTDLAIINNGTPSTMPGAPVYSSGSSTFCAPLVAANTVSVSGTGTIKWYSDVALTTPVAGATGSPIIITGATGTLMVPATVTVPTTYTFYATLTETGKCESLPRKVDIIVSPKPVPFTDGAHLNVTGVCAGATITLGGAPTLESPSVPGAYTYLWTVLNGGGSLSPANASLPNPSITVPSPGSATNYQYQVDITDSKNCTGTTTMTVGVKADFAVTLTSPPNTSLSYQNNPVVLTASIAGGSFSGPGVINTGGTNPYSFDPSLVYNVPAGGTQNFPINYTVTSAGCTKTVSPIATFQVYASTAPFGTFPTQFCSSEYPYSKFNPGDPLTYKELQLSSAMEIQVLAYVASYNGQTAHNTFATQIKFTGHIRNYYQGYYGGTVSGNPSIPLTSTSYNVNGHNYPQYGFITDQTYNNCSYCNYAYAGIYVEFNDVEYVKTAFPGYGLSTTAYDDGYVFYQPGVRSGFYYTGQYVQLNQIPTVSLNGLVDGANICKERVDSSPNQYSLSGTFNAGYFEVSLNGGTTYVKDAAVGNAIANHLPNDGTAILDSQKAWAEISTAASAWSGATFYSINKNVSHSGKYYRAIIANSGMTPDLNPTHWQENTLAMIIRYSYPPGTNASDNTTPCLAYSSIVVYLHDNPIVDFSGSVPSGTLPFCNDEASFTLTADKSSGMTYSGTGTSTLVFGVSGKFTPSVANPSGLSQVSSVITALHTDSNGCQADKTRTFKVNPKITAAFTSPRTSYCNEDIPVTLTGTLEGFTDATPTGQFSITYQNTSNAPVTTLASANHNYSFNPKVLYQNTYGSVNSSTQNIDVTYTETLTFGKACSNSVTVGLAIKAPIVLDITGLVSSPIFCSTDPNAPANNNTVTFQGNIPGFGLFSLDDDNDFSTINNSTLNSNITSSTGTGNIANLQAAYNASTNSGPIKQIYTQYAYTGPGCTAPATIVKPFQISPPPAIAFSGTTPPASQIFCNDGALANIQTTQAGGVTSVINGFGVIDGGTGSGAATFTPVNAYNASISAGGLINTNQIITLSATATDVNGCKQIVTRNYTVNKKPDASFTINGVTAGTSFDICYTDAPVTLQGNISKSWYSIVYKGTTTPFTETFGTGPADQAVPPVKFDPKAHFDYSTGTLGANALNTNQYDVIYSVADGQNCVNTLPAVTFNVAPQLDVDFAGLNNGDAYCSNDGAKPIVFSNFPPQSNKRIFTINGVTIPLSSNTYDFSQQYNKNGGTFNLVYTVLSGTNNCVNQITKSVNVLPSPTAQFTSVPRCKGDMIDYGADATLNSALATTYSWNFQDQTPVQITGQNVQYSFLSEGVYDVSLNAAFAINSGKVCQESIIKQQVVGGIPTADFDISNVCEGDQTQFKAKASSPAIFEYQWNFDDGETIGFGQGATFVQESGKPNSSGIYREPLHYFTYKTTPFNVTLTGRTPASSGGCVSTITKQVSVLKLLTPTPTDIYQMSNLNGGDGYFVSEDRNGNSKWIFGPSAPGGKINIQENAWNNTGYVPNDKSFMNSPCFDISAYQRPLFAIRYWTDTKPQIDGTAAQFSTDGGATWTTLGGFIGSVSTGLDWYDLQGVSGKPGEQNFNSASVAWSRRADTLWHDGRHSLDVIPGTKKKVRFRVAFGSDQSNEQLNLKGFAFSDVKIEERNRIVLAENFTNNTVSGSSKNNTDFYNFKNNTSEIVKLEYHIGLPTSDDINKQNPADANARAGFYGLTNSNSLVPKGYLDGLFSSGNFINAGSATWVDTQFSLRSLVPSPLSLAISTVPTDPDKIAVVVNVKAIKAITSGKLSLVVSIIEKNLGDGVGFVVRKLLPSASGTPLSLPLSMNQNVTFAPEAWEVKNVNNIQQLAIVAFIQDIETREVLQSAYLEHPANLPSIITGLENNPEELNTYPNPADRELTVQLPTYFTQGGSITISNQLGKIVHETSFLGGTKTKAINTRDLAEGMYILRMKSAKEVITKKVIIVHKQ